MHMPMPMRLLFMTTLLLGSALLFAPPANAADSERMRMADQRRALTQRFADEERACAARFAVTACMDDMRARRREALSPLRERELRLDESERQQRGAERRAAIASKIAEAASRPSAAAAVAAAASAAGEAMDPAASSASSAPVVRLRAPGTAASSMARAPKANGEDAVRATQAAQRVREAQARQQESVAAQKRIQRRLAEQAAKGRKSDPLPVPGTVPASGSGR